MTPAEARTAIRAATQHDADTQFTDAMLDVEAEHEYWRLRKRLQQLLPSLYESVTTPTIASGATTINKPSRFDRLILLERLVSGTNYFPIFADGGLNRRNPWGLSVHENPTTFTLSPDADAPGSYRLTVTQDPADYNTIDVPKGLEHIIVNRVAAWACRRHKEQSDVFAAEADRIWKEQLPMLRVRYGKHSERGLKRLAGY